MERRLEYINVDMLHPHPNNPRKDLGDLTELAESVRQSGIMQNLTVVPNKEIEGEYTVIIGHRRLGASKLAGMTAVPCVVVEMSEKEQLATMMLENMQRSDLTFYEQTEGFQLMIDLGETVESISEKTGLSKTTVRNRIKLAKYDREIMREAAIRQPTMDQYMRLCEIEDTDRANDVARFLGTRNFDREVDRALSEQKAKKQKAELLDLIKTIAVKYEGDVYADVREHKVINVTHFYTPVTDETKREIKKLKEQGIPLYYNEGYGYAIFRDYTPEDATAKDEGAINRAKREELERRATDLYEDMEMRAEAWVAAYRSKKGDIDTLVQHMFEAVVCGKLHANYQTYATAKALGWEMPEGAQTWHEETRGQAQDHINEHFEKDKARTMLLTIWHMHTREKPFTLAYRDTRLTRRTGCGWMFLFSLLTDLGYNVGDDEWQLVNGTHPLYAEEVPI